EVTVEDLTETQPYPGSTGNMPPSAATPPAASAAASMRAAAPRVELSAENGAVASPMAGAIKTVLVKEGEAVTKGKPLVVLEAMKMENQITAPVDGTVNQVKVKEGDSVQEGQVLVVLK
ncbi:MAG: biotin/lipoyl-binding protein, partial [Caldilineaceae bacterium]|nr:biotin/lipoyl-binding protein [Caldilineaceae bacterium]